MLDQPLFYLAEHIGRFLAELPLDRCPIAGQSASQTADDSAFGHAQSPGPHPARRTDSPVIAGEIEVRVLDNQPGFTLFERTLNLEGNPEFALRSERQQHRAALCSATLAVDPDVIDRQRDVSQGELDGQAFRR